MLKKKVRILTTILTIMITIFVLGCTNTPTRESSGAYLDDSVITTKIKADLALDKKIPYFQVSVETYKGEVQLSGFVNSKEDSERVEEITKKVAGVLKVINSLIVKSK